MSHGSASSANVASAVNAACFKLFTTAHKGDTSPEGCFMSPLSIVYALSLALNGAGAKSSTHSELLRVVAPSITESDLNSELGKAITLLNTQAADGSKVILANSVWTHRGTQLRKAYVDAMQSVYQATAREAVNGAKDVNAWVEGVTQGMIKDLVTSNDWDAILANAIYFKGLWTHAFKKERTFDGDFTTASNGIKQVKMMTQTFDKPENTVGVVRAQKEGLYDAIGLPYKGDVFRAVAVLPAPGVTMEAVLKDWATGQTFQQERRLKVVLPKFKVSSSLSLKGVLGQLGVKDAFGGGADFSRMSDSPMYISDVVHKAVVEVDEEGTVAAAATAVMMLRCAMPMEPPQLVFDRPFLFLIQHLPTGLPAFVGVVNDPTA